MSSPHEVRLKRLIYRSKYTGTRETDTLLGSFAERYLVHLTPAQLDQYEALIENSDPDLYMWISGQKSVPAEWDNEVMALLRSVRPNE